MMFLEGFKKKLGTKNYNTLITITLNFLKKIINKSDVLPLWVPACRK